MGDSLIQLPGNHKQNWGTVLGGGVCCMCVLKSPQVEVGERSCLWRVGKRQLLCLGFLCRMQQDGRDFVPRSRGIYKQL